MIKETGWGWYDSASDLEGEDNRLDSFCPISFTVPAYQVRHKYLPPLEVSTMRRRKEEQEREEEQENETRKRRSQEFMFWSPIQFPPAPPSPSSSSSSSFCTSTLSIYAFSATVQLVVFIVSTIWK